MSGQVLDALLGRVAGPLRYGDGAQHGVGLHAGRLGELDVEMLVKVLRHLVETGQRKTADKLVLGVGTYILHPFKNPPKI